MRIRDLLKRNADAPQTKPAMGEAAFSNPYHLFAGPPFTEYNPSVLVSRKGLRVFDEMRRDDQVKAAMSFKKHSILAGGWDVVSPEGAPEDWEPARIVEERLTKIEGGLENTLLQILTALDYGYSVSERVWKDGDDGVYLAAIKTRPPHDMEFVSDVYGNVTGLDQNGRRLPMEKFVVYSYAAEFSNHYGTSDLEAAYRPWWTKDNAYKWMAMLLERMGIPPIFALYDANAYKGDQLAKLKTIMARMQAATTGIIPRGDKDSIELWSPELAGQVSTVFIPAMDMFNRDIARAILMPGLLGATPDAAEGSYARAEVHFDVFMLVVEHVRREMQELMNERVVADILAVEVGPVEDPPRFEFRPLTDDIRLDLLEAWGKMVGANVVKPQAEDETHIRKQLKFPEREAKDEDYAPPPPQPVPPPPQPGQPQPIEGPGEQTKELSERIAEFYWDPDKHPRDERGRWSSGGGASVDFDRLGKVANFRPLSALPKEAIDQLHAREAKTFPKDFQSVVDGAADAFEEIKTEWPVIQENLDAKGIPVIVASYEPKGAAMTTVTGGGHAYLLLNTNYSNEFDDSTVGGKIATELMAKGVPRGEAERQLAKASLYHEVGHLIDRGTGGQLTNAVMDSVVLHERTLDARKVQAYMAKNISDYAASSPMEAAAELFSQVASGRKVAPAFNEIEKQLRIVYG